MYELTLSGLQRLGNSYYASYKANWLVIEVQVGDGIPEIIINRKENFKAKLDYYAVAYNEDLTLKANPNIKIIAYHVLDDINEYFAS